MRIIALGAAVAGLALITPAAAQPAPPPAKPAANQCFWVRDIYNYTVNNDEDVIYLRVRNKEVWKLELRARCVGLSDRLALPIRTFGGAGSVCNALDIDIRVRDHGMAIPCTVGEMRKLTPEEAAAIPKRDQP